MNIQDAKNEIINSIKVYLQKDEHGLYKIPINVRRPILLMGASGIGKTAVMRQAASESGINLVSYTITHHTRQSAVGLPVIKEKTFEGMPYSATEYTMSEIIASIYDKINETGIKEGILFIDEINCVSETLAPTMLQFLQNKTFGTHKVPDGFIICAAGNPPQYNKAVREFDIASLDRVRRIDVEPDVESWLAYASAAQVHPAVISFISSRPQDIYKAEKTGAGIEFVTPRAWEDLSFLLKAYEENGINVSEEITAEYIKHSDVNKRFYAFYSLYLKYMDEYDAFGIVSGNVKKSDRLRKAPFDERLIIINTVVDILEKNFAKYVYEDKFTDTIFAFLKNLKSLSDDGIAKAVSDKMSDVKRTIYNSSKNTVIDEFSIAINERFLKELRVYSDISAERENIFLKLKKRFDERIAKRDAFIGETVSYVENVYKFLESTFDDLQEIVIFTTKLTASKNAFYFLSENKCERYYRYNKELLFDKKQEEIISEITSYRNELDMLGKATV